MESFKEAAELPLNAEQEATNYVDRLNAEADLIFKEAWSMSQVHLKEALWSKGRSQKIGEEVDAESKSERQELKQLESRLAERS